jgi:hypothetical protein
MKILFRESCFRTNHILVGRNVSTIEIYMFGRTRATYPHAGLVGDSVENQDCKK